MEQIEMTRKDRQRLAGCNLKMNLAIYIQLEHRPIASYSVRY